MALLPLTIKHFTHYQHPLILHDDTINPKYLCEGCMTYGSGTRYHCHCCDFNLHEYCATCPKILSSFMHPHHSLKLVERDHLVDRFCKICCDLIEGLSYRCELCGFNVHPICSQLPETVNHILHQRHPLRLLGSAEAGTCGVCRGACNASSWRYRCALCEFDIHIDCLLIQCEKRVTKDRGIPTYVPPSRFDGYAYGSPYVPPSSFDGYAYGSPYVPPSRFDDYAHGSPYVPSSTFPQQHYFGGYNPIPNHFPGPSNMHHYNHNMPQHRPHERIGHKMFNLVKAITIGVISNMIFGMIFT